MPRTIYFTATTLDGFIATDDHSLDWLLTRESDTNGPMGVDTFLAGIGALAMGANTYRWIVENHSGEPWYYTVPAWVFTHRDFSPRTDADIRFTRESVPAVHAEMVAAAGDRDIWIVGGGELVGRFAEHGLLDEVAVGIAPVTIGSGKPLLPRHVELKQIELVANGEFACVRYAVVK
ncbi:dihydrofolate reductase family protein [Nocardia terpenica]|uniref:Deaminase n=1 Tax=Nocardia terpenica TaxID=455432 RepID=A0A291RES4_9NOCA|nr:dihydrofolate reductase family protein [Nocardia terpenica]ATL66086.1 deaminase [Nocardia terpenica]